MQIYFKQKLAFLAVPKTGTTAYERALRPEADITFAKRRKHMTAGQFERRMMPFLAQFYRLVPERMAVMRDPIEQIRSWYRYRTAPKSARLDGSTNEISFDAFVLGVLKDPQPPLFAIGSQHHFLTMADGSLPLEHLFAYERQPQIKAFLNDRFGRAITVPVRNVSPPKATPLSPDIEARLRQTRAAEFALYDRILQAGGHLRLPPR
ncbi:sulfotransferase family 2 domain-containing protein [Cognatishimia sp. SS12]|uniref:sulfotransferase family 2 domain-containing protein n=1 Tax=Cognatishimia sp. SS12 TaxID=2979465 RepID=UPI00232DD983|nr:sulfotransferase family 2 domain-containing protein [Cognatishimia sp. SS12]MDC0738729.1 sulfotransferase family 2 domain-containing protein [Cognatishimia sp. SS12]